MIYIYIYIYIIFFSSHSLSSHIFFSLSFQLVTQIRGHIAGSSPPFPLRYIYMYTLHIYCTQRNLVLSQLMRYLKSTFRTTSDRMPIPSGALFPLLLLILSTTPVRTCRHIVGKFNVNGSKKTQHVCVSPHLFPPRQVGITSS